MKFEMFDDNEYLARLTFEYNSKYILLTHDLAQAFLNDEFEINDIKRYKDVYKDGKFKETIEVPSGLKHFRLNGVDESFIITKREAERLDRTQRRFAQLLDKQLCNSFNKLIKAQRFLRNVLRTSYATLGGARTIKTFGSDWKERYKKAGEAIETYKFGLNLYANVHYTQILVKQQRRDEGCVPLYVRVGLFDILPEVEQDIRTDEPVCVDMSPTVHDGFLDAVIV